MKIEAAYEERLFGSNVAGAIFALKNHGWSDKQAVEHSTVVGGVLRAPATMTPEEWDRAAAESRNGRTAFVSTAVGVERRE